MRLNDSKRDIHIIEHIKRYCDEIASATARFGKSEKAFSADTHYQHACAMCIMQIGELSNRLSDDFKANHDTIPWRQITAVRNIVAHEYAKLDVKRTWATIESDIPALTAFCETILADKNPV